MPGEIKAHKIQKPMRNGFLTRVGIIIFWLKKITRITFWNKSTEHTHKKIKVNQTIANQLNYKYGKWYKVISQEIGEYLPTREMKTFYKVVNEDGEKLTICEHWVIKIK